MARGLQMLTGVVAAIAVFSIGTFLYLTREITIPSAELVVSVQPVVTPADTDEVTYSIQETGTTVAYVFYENANGPGKIVTGTNDQVSGEIVLNLVDLSQSRIGTVEINTGLLITDNDRDDSTATHFVAQSDDNSDTVIRFEAATISGISGTANVGDTIQFRATGNLTIAGVTKSAIFDVMVNLQSAGELTGHAETVISRADFDLIMPDASAADIGDAVTLKLDFYASAS